MILVCEIKAVKNKQFSVYLCLLTKLEFFGNNEIPFTCVITPMLHLTKFHSIKENWLVIFLCQLSKIAAKFIDYEKKKTVNTVKFFPRRSFAMETLTSFSSINPKISGFY